MRILVGVILILSMTMVSCAQNNKENKVIKKEVVKQKETTLEMNKDSLDNKIVENIEENIVKRKTELIKEAISTIGETNALLEEIRNGKTKEAIKKGELLIGKLEVLLLRNPSLALIPINVNYQKEELITDIETVRSTTKAAQEAMDDGYYQVASDLLEGMKSEMIINTYMLPTATYPEAIKVVVALLKDNKPKKAEVVIANVLGTIVIQKEVQPLPVLNAEQMIIEAALIDKENHENVDKVLNLLKNADYQLTLAEELGYGKKHKDFKTLVESIKVLKKSVTDKENSESKFDKIKEDIIKFKKDIFPTKKTK